MYNSIEEYMEKEGKKQEQVHKFLDENLDGQAIADKMANGQENEASKEMLDVFTRMFEELGED